MSLEIETRTQRDAFLNSLTLELQNAQPTLIVDFTCNCGWSASNCSCMPKEAANPRFVALQKKIKDLSQLAFCKCGSLAPANKKFCADCGLSLSEISKPHIGCPAWSALNPFCASCGKPSF
jgi:hypothetical protein